MEILLSAEMVIEIEMVVIEICILEKIVLSCGIAQQRIPS